MTKVNGPIALFMILMSGGVALAGGGDPGQEGEAYCIVDDFTVDDVGITCTDVTRRGEFISHETAVPAWEIEWTPQIFVSETFIDVCTPNDDLGFGMPVGSGISWGDDTSAERYPIGVTYTPTTTVLYAAVSFNADRSVTLSQQMSWPVELLPAAHNRPRGPYTLCEDGYPAVRVGRYPKTTWMTFELFYVDYNDI